MHGNAHVLLHAVGPRREHCLQPREAQEWVAHELLVLPVGAVLNLVRFASEKPGPVSVTLQVRYCPSGEVEVSTVTEPCEQSMIERVSAGGRG